MKQLNSPKFLTFSFSLHSPKRKEAKSSHARLKTFPQTMQEIPKMKLLRSQLSFPGLLRPTDGSAEFYSRARKTTRPGKLIRFATMRLSLNFFYFFLLEFGASK